MRVIKLGGSTLADGNTLGQLAQVLKVDPQPSIVVHGGGSAVTAVLKATNTPVRFVKGQRVTDDATIDTVEMVLSGRVNKHIVRALNAAGLTAMGLSGVDCDLVRVEPWSDDMPRVGRVVSVSPAPLLSLVAAGMVPVISPICVGPKGSYNVNADHVAGAIAGALPGAELVFLTDVPGIKAGGEWQTHLTAAQAEALIANETIHGGMIPKVTAALTSEAQRVRITHVNALNAGTTVG